MFCGEAKVSKTASESAYLFEIARTKGRPSPPCTHKLNDVRFQPAGTIAQPRTNLPSRRLADLPSLAMRRVVFRTLEQNLKPKTL
jgi:hypothetical protein